MDPVESRGSAVNPFRPHRATSARAMQAPSETTLLEPFYTWKDRWVTSRYEPESYASDPFAAPTLRVPLLQSRLREIGLWVGENTEMVTYWTSKSSLRPFRVSLPSGTRHGNEPTLPKGPRVTWRNRTVSGRMTYKLRFEGSEWLWNT
jgi:hypothetical protein